MKNTLKLKISFILFLFSLTSPLLAETEGNKSLRLYPCLAETECSEHAEGGVSHGWEQLGVNVMAGNEKEAISQCARIYRNTYADFLEESSKRGCFFKVSVISEM